MTTAVAIAVAALTTAASVVLWLIWRKSARAEYIRTYVLPPGLFGKLRKKRPELTLKDCELVGHALRQFFVAHLRSGCAFVSMPSQVTDDLWHELILYTKAYQQFCDRAFGRFLHHSPAVVLGSQRQSNEGLRRVWWHACIDENINPKSPRRLPLLFAIDAKLRIADGFRYSTDCGGLKRRDERDEAGRGDAVIYCGGDFASPTFDGTVDGFGEGGDGGDAGADGGGCGGGGCGGD